MIKELKSLNERPLDLLLLADPDTCMIQSYIEESRVFVYQVEQRTVGVIVCCQRGKESYEIMNVAVDPNFQRQKIGEQLVMYLLEEVLTKSNRPVTITVKTGETSHGALALYKKIGFEVKAINRDYFTENYVEPIYENGYLLRDQLVLEKKLI